jgi:hypothetical protein
MHGLVAVSWSIDPGTCSGAQRVGAVIMEGRARVRLDPGQFEHARIDAFLQHPVKLGKTLKPDRWLVWFEFVCAKSIGARRILFGHKRRWYRRT